MPDKSYLSLVDFDEKPFIVRLPGDALMAFFFRSLDGADPETARYSGYRITARTSTDHGQTWGPDTAILTLPTDQGGFFRQDGLVAQVDDEGEIHLFLLNDARSGVVPTLEKFVKVPGEDQRPAVGSMKEMRLDIWHTRSRAGHTQWPQPGPIWKGYSGSLNSVAMLRSGRIVLPFSYLTDRSWGERRGEGVECFTFMGQYDCTVVYSDDRGASWKVSPAALRVPVPDIVSAYGAVEPVVQELGDGRVWMVIRTQNGRFYESFSHDGVEWSTPMPTSIFASDSPPAITKLGDGRIVMFWNHCLRFPYAYGGRHVMHGAISSDNGRTWHGYREAARDLTRDQPPPRWGDHGMGYPFSVATAQDKVILSTGQGASKGACVLIEPGWFYEKKQKADFRRGLAEWSTFGTRGVELIDHPQPRASHKRSPARVLSVRREDPAWPAAAVWNFPASHRGRLRIRLRANAGFGGARLGLTDHFSVPFDAEDVFHNLYNVTLTSDASDAGAIMLPADTWVNLDLSWNADKNVCIIKLDGKRVAAAKQQRITASGVCYLRILSTSPSPDAGVLVESIEAKAK